MSKTKKNELMVPQELSAEQYKTLKKLIDPGDKLSKEQIDSFFYVAKKRGLDPFLRQIYGTVFFNSATQTYDLTILTSIDGFRLIADRTGKYAPGRQTEFIYNEKKQIIGATSFVKKLTKDGTWHEVAETAFMSEYKPTNPKKAMFWNKMPSVMIAKVAEARALRRAFPDSFSGIYCSEELDQSTNSDDLPQAEAEEIKKSTITEEQANTIRDMLKDRPDILQLLERTKPLEELDLERFPAACVWIKEQLEKPIKK